MKIILVLHCFQIYEFVQRKGLQILLNMFAVKITLRTLFFSAVVSENQLPGTA